MKATLDKGADRSHLKLIALDHGDTIRIHRTRLDGSLVPEPVDVLAVLHRRVPAYDGVTPHEWSRVVTLRANFYQPDAFGWTAAADDIRLPGGSLPGVEGGTVRRVNYSVLHHELADCKSPEGSVRHA